MVLKITKVGESSSQELAGYYNKTVYKYFDLEGQPVLEVEGEAANRQQLREALKGNKCQSVRFEFENVAVKNGVLTEFYIQKVKR